MSITRTSAKTKRKAALDRYTGQWVAFANGKVVAHKATLKGLMEKVKGLKFRKPSVMLVPRKREWPHV